jgi:hypothetical protein
VAIYERNKVYGIGRIWSWRPTPGFEAILSGI